MGTQPQRDRFIALLFWDVMWHRLVLGCKHCGTTHQCHLQGLDSLNLEDGTDRLS
jgi:hypothetical protein